MPFECNIIGYGYCGSPDVRHVVYVIHIYKNTVPNDGWVVYRRYSAFYSLYMTLRALNSAIPSCPPKHVFKTLLGNADGPAHLRQRRNELHTWLRKISLESKESITESAAFIAFMRAESNVVPPVFRAFVCTPDESSQKLAQEASEVSAAVAAAARAAVENVSWRDNVESQSASGPVNTSSQVNGRNGGASKMISNSNSNFSFLNSTGTNNHVHESEDNNMNLSNNDKGDSESSKRTERVTLADFDLIKVVGKGSFGKVLQVRKRDNGDIFAMKILVKKNIIKRNQVEHTLTERSVLGKIDHPFIVGLKYAFQDAQKLYFVLDYCGGGELFFHLGQEGRFSELRARFYTAEILLALDHLHKLNVIYRDLKPENILFTQEGHIRLADFGLSKEGVGDNLQGAHSFCGTPEYLAPEILNRSGHGCAVDWWSMGSLLFEMLTGLPPFYCKERQKMFARIRSASLRFPSYLSSSAVLLLQGLLTKDPNKRLGCGAGRDVEEIKSHPFFATIDWKGLLRGTVAAPWRPPTKDILDTSQFDDEFTQLPIFSPDQNPPNILDQYTTRDMKYKAPSSTSSQVAANANVNVQSYQQSIPVTENQNPLKPRQEDFCGFTYEAPNPFMANMFHGRSRKKNGHGKKNDSSQGDGSSSANGGASGKQTSHSYRSDCSTSMTSIGSIQNGRRHFSVDSFRNESSDDVEGEEETSDEEIRNKSGNMDIDMMEEIDMIDSISPEMDDGIMSTIGPMSPVFCNSGNSNQEKLHTQQRKDFSTGGIQIPKRQDNTMDEFGLQRPTQVGGESIG